MYIAFAQELKIVYKMPFLPPVFPYNYILVKQARQIEGD